MFEDWGNGVTSQLVLARENAEVRAVRVCGVHGGNVMTSNCEPVGAGLSLRSTATRTDDLHVGGVKGNPIEVESVEVIDYMFQEGVTGSGSHERVIEANGEARRRDPVDGEEEVHWLAALYVKIQVYATHFVENHVSDRVRALNLCRGETNQRLPSGRVNGGPRTHLVHNRGMSREFPGNSPPRKRLPARYPKARTAIRDRGGVRRSLRWR